MQPDITALAEALEGVTNAEELADLVAQRPELFDDEMSKHLAELAEREALPIVQGLIALVSLARSSPREAWVGWHRYLADGEAQARELAPRVEEIERLTADGAHDEAVAQSEGLVALLLKAGQGVLVTRLSLALAKSYRLRPSGTRGENLDLAIKHADAAQATMPDSESQIRERMNLAVLWGMRVNGDPAQNFEMSIRILRDALGACDGSTPGDLQATVEMNLAQALRTRERGDRRENLIEARALCLRSLEWRFVERNAYDWAFSMINLAAINDELAAMQEVDSQEAIHAAEEVIANEDAVANPHLMGTAHASLGAIRLRLARARRQEAGDRDVIGPGDPPPAGEDEQRELDSARSHLVSALTLLTDDENRDVRARALCDLGDVCDADGNKDGAVDAYREALDYAAPRSLPRQCAHAGGGLGALLAARDDWAGAAQAFTKAVEAREFGIAARIETDDRHLEIQRAGNTARWAGFALARRGDLEQAAIVLENGKGRELRRRLGQREDEEALERLPREARRDYLEARAELAASALGPTSQAAGRRLQETVTEIRLIPGFADFAAGVTLQGIADAVGVEEAVIYLNPSPWGTLLLAIHRTENGIGIEHRLLPATSHDLFMAISIGDLDEALAGLSGGGPKRRSFLLGPGLTKEDEELFCDSFDYLAETLGGWLGDPLADLIDSLGVSGTP